MPARPRRSGPTAAANAAEPPADSPGCSRAGVLGCSLAAAFALAPLIVAALVLAVVLQPREPPVTLAVDVPPYYLAASVREPVRSVAACHGSTPPEEPGGELWRAPFRLGDAPAGVGEVTLLRNHHGELSTVFAGGAELSIRANEPYSEPAYLPAEDRTRVGDQPGYTTASIEGQQLTWRWGECTAELTATSREARRWLPRLAEAVDEGSGPPQLGFPLDVSVVPAWLRVVGVSMTSHPSEAAWEAELLLGYVTDGWTGPGVVEVTVWDRDRLPHVASSAEEVDVQGRPASYEEGPRVCGAVITDDCARVTIRDLHGHHVTVTAFGDRLYRRLGPVAVSDRRREVLRVAEGLRPCEDSARTVLACPTTTAAGARGTGPSGSTSPP